MQPQLTLLEEAQQANETITSYRLIELLRHRHPAPEWATFAELMAGSGFADARRLDFFAVNTWPSKGHVAIAYEVKVSRGDFVNELRKPKKRRFAEEVANECYFVVPHGLVKVDEVPEGWGLLEANAGGLRRAKIAKQRRPDPWPMSFVTSLARRCTDAPSPLPIAMWKVAGRDLTEKELLALAGELWKGEVERERRKIEEEAVERFKESWAYRRLREVSEAVNEAFGTHSVTAEVVRERLIGKPTFTPALRWELEQARDTLNTLLNQVKEE